MLHLVCRACCGSSLGRGNYISGKPRREENRWFVRRLAAEVREEPEKERDGEAEDEAGDDGKVKRSMLAAMDDIAGKFAEVKRQFRVEIENGANNDQEASEEE